MLTTDDQTAVAPDATADSTTGTSQDSTGSASDSHNPVQSDSDPASATSSDGGAASQTDTTPANELVADALMPADATADTAIVPAASATSMDAEGAAGVVGQVIAVGTAVADIMKDSAPDYTMRGAPLSVIPQGALPLDLVGFSSDPHELKQEIVVRNHIGMLRADLPLVVQWHYGGRYKGHGQYINNASVFIDSGADIGAFYKVNINAALQGPANAGSVEEPLATVDVHIEVNITDKISPFFKMIVLEGKISGDGSGHLEQRP